MNFCPPNPGSTVITKAISIWLAHGAKYSTEVPGLIARPTCNKQICYITPITISILHYCGLSGPVGSSILKRMEYIHKLFSCKLFFKSTWISQVNVSKRQQFLENISRMYYLTNMFKSSFNAEEQLSTSGLLHLSFWVFHQTFPTLRMNSIKHYPHC